MKLNYEDKLLQLVIYGLLIVLSFVTLYPFWNSLIISMNVGSDTALGGVTFWPRKFTFENYKIVFMDQRLLQAFYVSVLRTVIGTFFSIISTALFAYGMSKRGLVGKKYYMIFCVVTMYFSGGLIPSYLLIRDLGMMNTFTVLVVPGLISVWNMIIFRTFFLELPEGLEESAKIDGCSHFGTFFKIVLPVSGPVIATLSLFTAVNYWNDWFTPTIYISNAKLYPIQTLLQQIMNSNIMSQQMLNVKDGNAGALSHLLSMHSITTKSLTMATMMVATIPIIIVYPFVQKYFVKGVLVGSLKG